MNFFLQESNVYVIFVVISEGDECELEDYLSTGGPWTLPARCLIYAGF
jgi:hypothetical protein